MCLFLLGVAAPRPSQWTEHTHILISVMVHFMCPLDWAMVPRYLVKHYSTCVYESVFVRDLHLNQWTLSKADCPPLCGWALPNHPKA